jgi:Lon protease-like protein
MESPIATLPMFPLGLVAFPGSVIPLRLFEPRYLALYDDLVAGSGEFGIVLIERGVAEAGGGEHFRTGTLVKMAGSSRLEDGSVVIVAVGVERLRVDRWLEDDPYPIAVVDVLSPASVPDTAAGMVNECRTLLIRVLALASELGADVGTGEIELSADPTTAIYEMARLAPLQELDQQRILEQESIEEAAGILRGELTGLIDLLTLQLGEG